MYLIILIIIIATAAIFLSLKNNREKKQGNKGIPEIVSEEEIINNNKINSDSSEPAPNFKQQFDAAMANASKAFVQGNYSTALKYYNEALSYKKSDLVYAGMFNVYSAQKDWLKAEETINKALALDATYTEYWKWKLILLDEKTDATFAELKKIYAEGLTKGNPKNKINLVTYFAGIAESNNEKTEAVALWEEAIRLNPVKESIYQAEIDRLKGIL